MSTGPATRGSSADGGDDRVPARWLDALLVLHDAAHVEPYARAVQALFHAAIPPLRAVGVMFHPFEWQFPLLFCEPGEEEDWRKWMDRARADDIWLHRAKPTPSYTVGRHTDHTPDALLIESRIYRDLMCHHRIRYGAAVMVWENQHPLLLVQLLRATEQGDFEDDEMAIVQRLQPHIASSVKRLMREQRGNAARMALERVITDSESALLMVDWNLRPQAHNVPALAALHRWAQGGQRSRATKPPRKLTVPADLRAECERFKSSQSTSALALEGKVSRWTVPHPTETSWRCEIACYSGRPLSHPLFVLRIETPALESVPTAGTPSVSQNGLSPREREIVTLLRQGRTNREIAKALGKSEATVRNQLHSVFEKLGLKRRTELIARFRG